MQITLVLILILLQKLLESKQFRVHIKPFVPSTLFLYLLKTSENLMVF